MQRDEHQRNGKEDDLQGLESVTERENRDADDGCVLNDRHEAERNRTRHLGQNLNFRNEILRSRHVICKNETELRLKLLTNNCFCPTFKNVVTAMFSE